MTDADKAGAFGRGEGVLGENFGRCSSDCGPGGKFADGPCETLADCGGAAAGARCTCSAMDRPLDDDMGRPPWVIFAVAIIALVLVAFGGRFLCGRHGKQGSRAQGRNQMARHDMQQRSIQAEAASTAPPAEAP
eukprot:COSAG01_NODE_701_length_14168_cov_6.656052_7_plen_134_part_00